MDRKPMDPGILYVHALVIGCLLAVAFGTVLSEGRSGGETVVTTTQTTVRIRPGPGQAFLSGTAQLVVADDAQATPVPSPFTLSAVDRGVGKVTIENALIGGKRTTIAWGGGTPLPLSAAGGGIELSGATVQVDATGITWKLAGTPRHLLPGEYQAGAPVATGSSGLANARDGVVFTADDRTIVNPVGDVVIKLPAQRLDITGPGNVAATGTLTVVEPDATRPATAVQFGEGPYQAALDPSSGTLQISAVLQGPLKVT
jgi:hypothetical protein